MFEPGSTIVHQGSLACPLLLLCLLAYSLDRFHWLALAGVAVLGGAQSASLLLPAPPSRPMPLHPEGVALALLGLLGALLMLRSEPKFESR